MSAAADERTPLQARASPRSRADGLVATAAICTGLILWGAIFRSESNIIAEEGLGYWLGIAGLAMMTLLLTYSLRKRMPVLLGRFSIRRWFEIHMMLGLVGPTAILFHCNFRLGSLNSSVALVSMLLVAASGIAGRFMYTRIHHGLLGDLATLSELHEAIVSKRNDLSSLGHHAEDAEAALVEFEERVLAPRRGALSSTIRFFSLGWRSHAAARICRRASLQISDAAARHAYRAAVHDHIAAVRRAAEFTAYAWLFSLWHAVHLPLCILLFAAAVLHVLAVNLY